MLLPNPEGPTIAVDWPAGILKVTLVKVLGYSIGAVGYLKDT